MIRPSIRRIELVVLGMVGCLFFASVTYGGEPNLGSYSRYLNLESPTMGGMQIWSDVHVLHDWRIQRNALTGHCRLLDDNNVRRAWGTTDYCETELDRFKTRETIPEVSGPVVVMLHGLGSTRRCMDSLGDYIRENGAFTVLNVSYASTRGDFADHAATLRAVLDHLNSVDELYFVCHSMGNLVLRQYIDDCRHREDGDKSLKRIKRIVMLGPPNKGAQLAERLQNVTMLERVVGKAATRLAKEGQSYTAALARPDCEFGIIAAGVGNDEGINPLLTGDDDLVVRVEETKLDGARDFLTVSSQHRMMLYDAKVHEHALCFLKNGYFVSADSRHPIPGN